MTTNGLKPGFRVNHFLTHREVVLVCGLRSPRAYPVSPSGFSSLKLGPRVPRAALFLCVGGGDLGPASGRRPMRSRQEKLVLPRRIELRTPSLPRTCSTTELRQHLAGVAEPIHDASPLGKARAVPTVGAVCRRDRNFPSAIKTAPHLEPIAQRSSRRTQDALQKNEQLPRSGARRAFAENARRPMSSI